MSASVAAQLSVPIYQGGAEYSTIRQAKETLGQRRLDLDTARDQVQSTVTQAWGQLEAAKAQINATQAQVTAAEIALNGVREEARVGQRTTLDVLNAQQDLVNARVALVTAQRDRVVASYTVLAAVGGLSPQILGLKIRGLRSDGPLSAGPRRMGRRAHARRALGARSDRSIGTRSSSLSAHAEPVSTFPQDAHRRASIHSSLFAFDLRHAILFTTPAD